MNKKNILKALTYIVKKRHHALDWDGILYDEIVRAYRSGQIYQKYQISFDDLLSKYGIKVSPEDVRIPLKWEPHSISDLETHFICAIALGMRAEKIFEIGTYLGRTAVNLAYNTGKNAKIYTLDSFHSFNAFHVYHFHLPPDVTVGKYIKEHKEIADKVIQLFGDSRKFDFSPYYNQIDLMFIDGNHYHDYVLNDGKKAIQCVKNGGFIIWHDFDYRFLGLCKAVIEICSENKLDLNRIDITPLAIAKVKK